MTTADQNKVGTSFDNENNGDETVGAVGVVGDGSASQTLFEYQTSRRRASRQERHKKSYYLPFSTASSLKLLCLTRLRHLRQRRLRRHRQQLHRLRLLALLGALGRRG